MKIGITGCTGRMGRMLVETVLTAEGVTLAGGTDRPGSPFLGQDVAGQAGLAPVGSRVTQDAPALFAASDVVIDFTSPDATLAHGALARSGGTALVVGTTGLDPDRKKRLTAHAAGAPIVFAPNMSLGVNLVFALVEKVAGALGPDIADIEIVELHHKHKVDAPSGTALGIGEAAARGRGVDPDAAAVLGRVGHTGTRPPGAIGFAALRGGDAVGEHTALFAMAGERLEITHKATDRAIFARGAVQAARWIAGKPAGLYSMMDVLGLS